MATAATVSVDAQFIGGVFGNFNIDYATGDPAIQLQQITVELKSPLFTDSSFSPPGSLLPFAFTPLAGAAETGFAGASGIFDGATSFTLLFADFNPGEAFNFELDVDSPCGWLCLSGSLTSGSEFAGSKLIATFGSPSHQPQSLSGLFTSGDCDLTAQANITGDVATPEPGTIGLLGAGLVVLAIRLRKIRS
jgi:hypothetical protein